SFVGLKAPVYFDDIKVIKTSDSSVVIDQNFEAVSTTVSAPTNISAVSGDKSVTFSWNTVSNDTRFYNVYEKLSDGTYILRARTKHADAGITLSNLEEGKVYDFTVTGSALIGLESARGANRFKIKVVNPEELYEPKEFTYTYGGNSSGGYRLAWKNPSASTLQRVTVYSIGEDNASQTVASPTPGAVSEVTVYAGNTSRYGNYDKFRLIFEFSDGKTREVYYTGREILDVSGAISNTAGLYYANKWSANSAHTRVNVFIQNDDAIGNNALQVISNRAGVQDNEYAIFFDGAMYQKLQSGTEYKIAMKVKAEKDVSFGIRTRYNNSDITRISVTGDYDWQDIETTFTANTNEYLSLGFGTLASSVYIDNVEVTRVSDDAVMVSQNFEEVSETYSAPTGISVAAGNGSATFQWTPSASSDSRYVNVYEQLSNGTLVLRAKVRHSDTGVTLSELENDKEYSFVVSGGSIIGLETAKSSVYTATPTLPDYEILSPVLKKNGAEVDALTDGTHSVSVDVRNNKLEDGFSAKLIAAVYNVGADTEELEHFYFTPINSLSIDTEYTTYNVNNISISDLSSKNCVLRVMLWNDFSEIHPLCNQTEFGE
ncbi:MAG: hypothetical protein IJQ28_01430, partial [Clostridia bacterium]|nr:hypothetical protein [Clostridia bacterium]